MKDITPLANLTNLTELILTRNQVSDLTPLANLVNLERLYLQHNLASDFTPLQGLNLVEFYYDQPCDVPPLLPPIRERIENRIFPSIFQSWDHVVGQDHLTVDQRYALHDLFWNPIHEWGLYWHTTLAEPTWGVSTSLIGDFEYAREIHQRWLELNPNMLFLADMNLAYHWEIEDLPPDSDFWVRDNQGQIVQNALGEYLINFLKPEVQDLLIKRIIAIGQCGLADGVMLDGFNNNGIGFVGRDFFL